MVSDNHNRAIQNAYRQKPFTILLCILLPKFHSCCIVEKIEHKNFGIVHLSFFVLLSSPLHITQKLQCVYACSTYQMTALLLVMFLFWFIAACEEWLLSYSLEHTPQSSSNTPFSVCFHAQHEYYRVCMNSLQIKQVIYYRRCLLSSLEICASNKWWATVPNTQRSLFDMTFVCISSVTWY